MCRRTKSSPLISVYRNAAYVFSGTFRDLVSLHCPLENFMNNFQVHQCAPEEATGESAGIAEENTVLGLFCFVLLFDDCYLRKAMVLRTVLEEIQSNRSEILAKIFPKINLIISVKASMHLVSSNRQVHHMYVETKCIKQMFLIANVLILLDK